MIEKEIQTKNYFKGVEVLLCASHWIDKDNTPIKIPQGLKAYYQYRLKRYKSFAFHNKHYNESHITVSKLLGLSTDTVKKVYNPLLIRMGLIESKGSFKDNNVTYILNEVNEVVGTLVNYKLPETRHQPLDYKKDGKPFTYENIQILENNKRVAKRIKSNSDVVLSSVERGRLHELLRIEREYNKQFNKENEGNE